MNPIYRTVGVSKQAFHQWANRTLSRYEEQQQLLPIIEQLREDHPKMSCREFYYMLKPNSMGRDRFEIFCYENGFKVPVKRSRYKTTNSKGVNPFPNHLLKMNELTGVNQLWVSDITYFALKSWVYYLTFIMDIYNRKIVGYSASDNLTTVSTTLSAFTMATRNTRLETESGLVLHSDGGGQYFCKKFVALTKDYQVINSMGKTAYENPFAERINGTIKNNYLIPYGPQNFNELRRMLKKAVNLYNYKKPHQALGRRTPVEFTEQVNKGLLNKIWIINKRKTTKTKEKVNIFIN